MVALLLSTLFVANGPSAPDTVVVVPQQLRGALAPWARYREAQGHRLAWITGGESAEEIRAGIRRLAQGGALRHVVLVGDAVVGPGEDQAGGVTPTHLAAAKINLRWGSEREIATDNWYADLDDDQLPDLAIGRLTADNSAELSDMLERVMAYEAGARRGAWQRRLNFIAGVGGFGPLVDAVLERATKRFLTQGIPAEYAVSMTYGSWRSPFCPDPRRFQDAVIDRFNEGCLFWVYIGHGQQSFLDHVRVPGGTFPIFGSHDIPRLRSSGRAPIAVFLACYTGAFDQPSDCLAEEMLRSTDGPVAVLASSRVSMPYAMAVMGDELMTQCFRARRTTLGELFMHAKRRMADDRDEPNLNRQLLDAIAGAISPVADQLAAERLEHVLLFNLLGDPLLRLRHAEQVILTAPRNIAAGQELNVSWQSPIAGRGTVELVCRRDRSRDPLPARRQFVHQDSSLSDFTAVYQRANDRCWIRERLELSSGPGEATLQIPAEARGPCHVRLFIEGEQACALGASNVFVRRPVKPKEGDSPAPALLRN